VGVPHRRAGDPSPPSATSTARAATSFGSALLGHHGGSSRRDGLRHHHRRHAKRAAEGHRRVSPWRRRPGRRERRRQSTSSWGGNTDGRGSSRWDGKTATRSGPHTSATARSSANRHGRLQRRRRQTSWSHLDGPYALDGRRASSSSASSRPVDAELPPDRRCDRKGQLSIIVAGETGSHQEIISANACPPRQATFGARWPMSARTPPTGSWTNPPLVQNACVRPAATGCCV